MVLFGVALAVAAVPEALPAIVTGTLAISIWEMAKNRVLVRRMPVVETFECIIVVCSDKTWEEPLKGLEANKLQNPL